MYMYVTIRSSWTGDEYDDYFYDQDGKYSNHDLSYDLTRLSTIERDMLRFLYDAMQFYNNTIITNDFNWKLIVLIEKKFFWQSKMFYDFNDTETRLPR